MKLAVLFVSLAFSAASAQAGLITSAPPGGTTLLDFNAFPDQRISLGPVDLFAENGAKATFTAINPFGVAVFSSILYGLGDNGVWSNKAYTSASVNGDEQQGLLSSMTFTFETGVATVGGFMNYVFSTSPNPYYDASTVAIRALGKDGSILEEYKLEELAPIRTLNGENEGAFRGITRAGADIFAFQMTGGTIVRNLQFDGAALAPVPEPASIALFTGALFALGAATRRGKGGKAASAQSTTRLR